VEQLSAVDVRTSVPAADVVGGRWATGVQVAGGIYVRVMVRSRRGIVVGFSNPVWVLPPAQASRVTVPAARLRS
jgi:hypothetical protein